MGRQGDRETRGEICYSSAAVLREALEARTDDRCIVAELLEVPVEKADSHLPHIASVDTLARLPGRTT